jgi:hypothetical protein
MNLKEQFPSDMSGWVAYNQCEYKYENGRSMIRPQQDSQTMLYNPLEPEMTQLLLLEALNIGRQIKQETIDEKQAILDFIESFGFLGVCADLPLNEDFLREGTNVHISDNPFDFPVGTMKLAKYLDYFFPAGYLPSQEDNLGKVTRRGDLYNSIFSTSYGEDFRWYKRYFLRLYNYFLACLNYDRERRTVEIVSEYQVKRLHYTVTAESKPKLQWIFPSLKSVIDMAMALCVTAEDMPLRVCKKCRKIFYSENARSEFCSGRCRNQWNVYKSRGTLEQNVREAMKEHIAKATRDKVKKARAQKSLEDTTE